MNPIFRLAALTVPALLFAGSAQAHVGVGPAGGFPAGLLHPLGGLDHLLAMVAVGAWAAMKGGRAFWILPACFIAGMLAGGIIGFQTGALPVVELGIVGSVILLGLMIAVDLKLSSVLAMVLVGLFGLAHGHAHGTELPAGASGLLYAQGFLLATAVLHGLGMLAGHLASLQGRMVALRLGGGAVAAAGLLLLIV
jgi:urease accessory protein